MEGLVLADKAQVDGILGLLMLQRAEVQGEGQHSVVPSIGVLSLCPFHALLAMVGGNHVRVVVEATCWCWPGAPGTLHSPAPAASAATQAGCRGPG